LGQSVKVRILDGHNGTVLGPYTAFPRRVGPLEVRMVDRNHDGRADILVVLGRQRRLFLGRP
jgi:hypothetical protein